MTERGSTTDDIRFNVPALEGRELEYMQQAVTAGHTSAGGPFSKQAAEVLQAETGAEEVLLTTSCTSALELSAMLLDLQPGDTVVVPSFTFTSSALAFAREGAKIVFCDIEPQTLGLDPAHLESLLDDSVRAVVPVHYAGVACDMEGLGKALEGRPDVAVVEDNAHGLFGRWQGRRLGHLGRFATLSFHETKNIICGEGGALLVNEGRDVDRARVLYDKGTNRRAFFLGQVDKYSWMDTGSSFGLSDLLAGYLFGQLEQREVIQAKRRTVFDRYAAMLSPHVADRGISLPVVPPDRESAYHMFYVLLPDRATRDDALQGMRSLGVQPTFHYVPLHSSVGGRKVAARAVDCPVTDDISGRLMRLPFHNNLTEAQSERVVAALLSSVPA
ncbi:MAG: dTDP-4-amino-4,6-dideoxygalactose transaminase [Actinomycetota bacterium]|jgi:dTDP-4-amino-4,6-dideoxygalactose transaminase|nr:dTDP-4-amino-4,6-dideoxygalactose transaminase [Actinomycetota bacterium]